MTMKTIISIWGGLEFLSFGFYAHSLCEVRSTIADGTQDVMEFSPIWFVISSTPWIHRVQNHVRSDMGASPELSFGLRLAIAQADDRPAMPYLSERAPADATMKPLLNATTKL